MAIEENDSKDSLLCHCDAMMRPSAWVMRFAVLLPRRAHVLDVACGEGRHTAYFALRGARVTAVDIDLHAIEPLAGAPGITLECRDLEKEPWPYADEAFDAIVVTNYLHRPHFEHYMRSLRPGGVFIMETFTKANGLIWGRPRNPAHYLLERELLMLTPAEAHIVAYEEGMTTEDHAVARIVWTKPADAEPYGQPLGTR